MHTLERLYNLPAETGICQGLGGGIPGCLCGPKSVQQSLEADGSDTFDHIKAHPIYTGVVQG